jgi:predicted nucleic acid-binding protein
MALIGLLSGCALRNHRNFSMARFAVAEVLERLGRPPIFADAQIAATAIVNRLILVTANVKDFARFEGLVVESWFEGQRE